MRLLRPLLGTLALLPSLALAQQTSAGRTSSPSVSTPTSNDVLPFRATETTLPNGLKVIVVPTGFPNIVSIQIPVQTGSRNEVEAGKSGFAHFFEHMMFRGTPKYSPEQFTAVMTRAGARNNATTNDDRTLYYVMTATQDAQLGYALDSKWYGTTDFTSYMRNALSRLTRQHVNDAIKRHLSAKDLSVVVIAKDAEAFRDALLADSFSPIKYDSDKPAELLAEDKVIGARKLTIRPDKVKITPVEEVFAR